MNENLIGGWMLALPDKKAITLLTMDKKITKFKTKKKEQFLLEEPELDVGIKFTIC